MIWDYAFMIWALTAAAGGLIGDRKGRAGEGVVWGLLLSLIGLVIIAMRTPTESVKIRQAQDSMRIEKAARAALERERPTY